MLRAGQLSSRVNGTYILEFGRRSLFFSACMFHFSSQVISMLIMFNFEAILALREGYTFSNPGGDLTSQ
jgi:hypothetical protein